MKTMLLFVFAALFAASAVYAAPSPLEVAYQAAMAKKVQAAQQAQNNGKGTEVPEPWLVYKVDCTTLLQESVTVTNAVPVELTRTVGTNREWATSVVTSRVTAAVTVMESVDRPVWVRGRWHRICLAFGARE